MQRRLHTHVFGATVAHVELPALLPSGGTESHVQLNVYSWGVRKTPVDGALKSSSQGSCCTGLELLRYHGDEDPAGSFVESFLAPVLYDSAYLAAPGTVGSDVESERNRA